MISRSGIFRIICTVLIYGELSFAAHADEKVVRLATIEFPPYTGESLENGGALTELASAAFQLSGYRVETFYLPWMRGFEMAKLGDYDGLMDMWYRPEREKYFIFSVPTESNRIVFFKRKDNPAEFTTYDALRSYSIGIIRGYANPPNLAGLTDEMEAVDGEITNIKKLIGRRIDLVVMDYTVGWYFIRSRFRSYADQLTTLPVVLKEDPIHIGFSRAVPDIEIKVKAFNEGINALKKSGAYGDIISKHGL